MKSRSRLILTIAVTTLLATTSACGQHESTNRSSYNEESVHMYIAGYEYAIPKNYLDGPLDNPKGKRKRGVLLAVTLPEFESRTPDNGTKFSNLRTSARVNLTTPNSGRADQKHFEFRFQIDLGKPGSPSSIAPYNEIARDDGLIYYEPIGREPPSERNDLYAGFDENGDLDVIIDCTNDHEVPNPGCTQEVLLDDVIVRISYNKDNLSHWYEYRQKAEALIRSFRVGPAAETSEASVE